MKATSGGPRALFARRLACITFAGLLPSSMACGDRTELGTLDARPSPVDAGMEAEGPVLPCGSVTCGAGEICVRGRCGGCCDFPPECIPIPETCAGGPLSCGCIEAPTCGCAECLRVTHEQGIVCGNCGCTCAAPRSPVGTPTGPARIADLGVGDLVYSVDHGAVVVVPIVRVNRQAVVRHAMARVTLSTGARIELSGGHPTADGRRLDALGPGDHLGDVEISAIETVPYDEPFTYDILPASDSGVYFVAGALVGSTLHAPAWTEAGTRSCGALH